MPQNHPFIVGERYADRIGEYTVIAIKGDLLKIKYDDGKEAEGGIEIKARIFKNILNEHRHFHPIQSQGYFFFLGYLAAHAELHAEVPPQSQPGFEENYLMLVGVRPKLHVDNYFPIHIVTTWDKWGPELRIYFPEVKHNVDLPPGVDLKAGNEPGILRVNNNQFWWTLIKLGFRLGKQHDVAKIRSTIPPKFQTDFGAGMNS